MRYARALLIVAAALAAHAAAADFHFAILGDRTGSHVDAVYDGIVAEVNGLAPDFVVTVGDQIEGYTDDAATLTEQWDEYLGIVAPLTVPLYICPGNHDITTDGQLPAWRERTGREPCYSFNYEKVHVVVLDTSRWDTSEAWLAESGYGEWLEKDLAKNARAPLTVVIYHKPYWYNTLAEGEPDPMHELFKTYGVDAVFNGHFHIYATADYDGVKYTIVGSSGGGILKEDEDFGAFFQYVWATVKDGELSWTVMKRGSALPADVVTTADVAFAESVATELVWPEPFRPDAAGAGSCRLAVVNAGDTPLKMTVAWEGEGNWTVTPAEAEIALEPNARGDVAFEAKTTGAFYPVPTLKGSYPYRDGKAAKFEHALPALRTQPVGRVASPPAVDGVLDDACWKDAAFVDYFASNEGGPSKIEPTVFRFGYDDEYLYVAARCDQADMATIKAAATERDGAVFADDCVGFFFLPEDGGPIYQIYVNAAGTVMDIVNVVVGPGRVEQDRSWDGGVAVATARGEGAWTAEMAIPFAAMETYAPGAGATWRTNFRRKEISLGSYADWQYPLGFDPRLLGYLAFQ